MAGQLIKQVRARAGREREALRSGQPPSRRMKHPVQRAAAKALAVFFVLMLVLTVLSRAADGLTVARVTAEGAKTGVLTQRITMSGTIAAQGDLELSLPAGLKVLRAVAEQGARVEVGDTLLELDADALRSAIEKLENDIALLDLKIANAAMGNSSASSDAVLAAQDALASAQAALVQAQEDYDRLAAGRGTAEDRAEEDLRQAQADYDAAAETLERAKGKAGEELRKAARDKLEAAKDALDTVRESARDAKTAAEQALASAQENANATSIQYWNASSSYSDANDALREAQRALDAAIEGGDEAAISAARTAYLQAKSGLASAEMSLNSADAADTAASKTLKRAKEDLENIGGKWKDKLERAQRDYQKAEDAYNEAQSRTDMSEEALVVSAQSALDGVERALQSARRAAEDASTATADQLLAAQRAIDAAQRSAESARRGVETARRQAERERLTDQNAAAQAEIERLGFVGQRREAQRTLDALRAVAQADGRLTAPIAGTVLNIYAEKGLTQEGAVAAVLSRGDQGFQFEGTMDQKEAERLAVGDKGTLSFTLEGRSQTVRDVTVLSIGMADEKGMVKVTARLDGEGWPTGVSASLEVAKRSEQYQSCLPLGALRSDADGEYVLALREKQTVMGTEQTVERVNVKTLAKDSENMAVEADGLLYGDRVVTSASKPVSPGDRVRLAAQQ